MKTCLFILFFFLSIKSNGQDNCIIVGRWSVINVSNINFFYDIKTDSISITGLLNKIYPDSISKQKVFDHIKNVYGALDYEFYEDGVYKMYMDTSLYNEGCYKFSVSESTIEFISKDSLNQETGDKVRYHFKERVLLFNNENDAEKLSTVLKRKW